LSRVSYVSRVLFLSRVSFVSRVSSPSRVPFLSRVSSLSRISSMSRVLFFQASSSYLISFRKTVSDYSVSKCVSHFLLSIP
jgi:hypothetical protein